jgi:hypothetical protein
MAAGVAINILLDAVVTIQGTTGGDDGNPTRTLAATPITIEVNKVTVRNGRETSDHGTAQRAAQMHRTTKQPQEMTIETVLDKLAAAPLLGLLNSTAGVVVVVTITAVGCSIDGAVAIVTSFDFDYDAPSTLRIELRQYGTLWTIDNA